MIVRGLTKDAETILKAVNKFGCIDFEQLKYFIDSPKTTDSTGVPYTVSIANHLAYTKQAVKDGNTLCSRRDKVRSLKMIDSIWGVLYLLSQKGSDESPAEDLDMNCQKGADYCTIEMFLNGTTWVKFLPCYNASDVMTVLAEQEKHAIATAGLKNKHRMPLEYYVVTRNKDAITELSKYELTIPVSVMYLQGEEGEQPQIRIGRLKKE